MSTRRTLQLLLLGILLGLATRAVETQAPTLMFGVLSGAPKAVAVDTNGYVQLKVN